MLDHVSKRALVAAQRSSVNDVRQLLLTVLIDIVHTEALSQQHIYLNSYQRVLFAVNVLVLNVEFRAVECRFIDAYIVVNAEVVEYLLHSRLRFFPLFLSALILVVRVRGIPLRESECAVLKQTYRVEHIFCKL